jgi:hypothetical protein
MKKPTSSIGQPKSHSTPQMFSSRNENQNNQFQEFRRRKLSTIKVLPSPLNSPRSHEQTENPNVSNQETTKFLKNLKLSEILKNEDSKEFFKKFSVKEQ